MASSCRALTTSTSAGPLCARAASMALFSSCGFSTRKPRTPIACAINAKFGFLRSQPASRKPLAFISISTKPSVPLFRTMTLTGNPIWVSVMKSPIIMLKPPSPDIEITCRFGICRLRADRLQHRVRHRSVIERTNDPAPAVDL